MSSPIDDLPIAAVQAIQLKTYRRVVAKIFDVLDPIHRQELDAVLHGDLLGVLDDLSHQPMTSSERALVSLGVEEIVLIRNMLSVGSDADGMAVGE